MRVVVLRNSIAGRGECRRAVDALVRRLAEASCDPHILDVNRALPRDEVLAAALRQAQALIVAGGDGTMHHTAQLLIEIGVPVVHFPMGTENLFAREFGHSRDPASVIAAIRRLSPQRVDVGLCDDRPFLLMASVGFDSCVVERIAAARTGGISHLTYVRHSAAEFLRPRFVPLTVRVDGHELVAGQPGMVVVANSRQYAARLDPARNASMTDGLLDVVFLPIGSRVALLRRSLQVITGGHLRDAGIVSSRGAQVSIIAHAAIPLQLDGEYAGTLIAGQEVRFGIRASALSVLTP